MGTPFKPSYKFAFWFWVFDILYLGDLGSQPAVYPYVGLSMIFTFLYFFFFIFIYYHTKYENKLYDIEKGLILQGDEVNKVLKIDFNSIYYDH
jgi:hypothetical protein